MAEMLIGAMMGIGLQLFADKSVTKQYGGDKKGRSSKDVKKSSEDTKMTVYNKRRTERLVIVPNAFEHVILNMTKMNINDDVTKFFVNVHDALLTMKITPDFCCDQKGKLFDVLEEGIGLLETREQRQQVMNLARQWRLVKCEEEFSDWRKFCDTWKLNLMEIETMKAKSRLALQQKKNENTLEIRQKLKTSLITVALRIKYQLLAAGIAAVGVRLALNIIPKYFGYMKGLEIKCETTKTGWNDWWKNDTEKSNSWICQNSGSGWLANVFASSILEFLKVIGKVGEAGENVTSDLSNTIALIVFVMAFLLTIVFGEKERLK
jgi:hypothetical protein